MRTQNLCLMMKEKKSKFTNLYQFRKEKKLLRELEQKKKLEEAIYTMNKEKVAFTIIIIINKN